MPAAELYTSALFRGRRADIERTCDRWFILSAKHGVLDPPDLVEPYDVSLTSMSTQARRAWSTTVLEDLQRRLGELSGMAFEIHAGLAYRDSGSSKAFAAVGRSLSFPAEGLGQGQQLAFLQVSAVVNSTDVVESHQELYRLLDDLPDRSGGFRYLRDCTGRLAWPQRGVYFFSTIVSDARTEVFV